MKPRQPSTGHVKGYCSRLHRVQAPSHPGSCQIIPSRRGGRTPFHAQKRRIIVLMSSPRSCARPSKRSARTTARSVRRTCVRRRRPSPTSFLGALHHWPAKIEEAHGFERQRLQRRAARGSRCVDPYHSLRARTGRIRPCGHVPRIAPGKSHASCQRRRGSRRGVSPSAECGSPLPSDGRRAREALAYPGHVLKRVPPGSPAVAWRL